ncbi:MAG TPA: serine hydrolase domain-containing protein [Gemmatimonadales bacterium]
MTLTYRRVPTIACLTVLLSASAAAAQQSDRARIIATIDSLANAPIAEGRVAGLSVAVVRGRDTLVLKGYGSADLELEVPTPDRAVYEIGSVTKQFTAVAVLQLRDRGLLSLDDEVTEYLPDYPTQGHHVTIRRLLDHTSGIKGITEIPEFENFVRRDLPRDSLVAVFASKPFDFAPGEAMIYNNSAYFLLGRIIAQVSGETYEDYVARHLFAPAGMPDSRYCSERTVIPRKVKGYESRDSALVKAGFIVHLWPYAAGSLCSTAGDLLSWNRALHGNGRGGSLLNAGSYRELITPGALNDGTPLRYAKGLAVFERGGRRLIAHSGGIFGFVSYLGYYPDDSLAVAVLINTAGAVDAGAVANGIVDAVLGESVPPPVRPFEGSLEPLVGTYSGPGRGRPITVTVSIDSTGALQAVLGRGNPQRLSFLEGTTFGAGTTRVRFVRVAGRVTALQMDQVSGVYVLPRDDD